MTSGPQNATPGQLSKTPTPGEETQGQEVL